MKKIIYLILIAFVVYAGWIPGVATSSDISDSLNTGNLILSPDCLVVRSYVDMDSFPKLRIPFAKFYKGIEYAAVKADTLIPVPVCNVSGTSNTYHFVPVATGRGDSMFYVQRNMIIRITSRGNLNVGVNTDEEAVLSIGKLNASSTDTTWSRCGTWSYKGARAIGDQEPFNFSSDLMCSAGDTIGVFFKTTDTGVTLKDNPNTKTETSISINLEYIREL